jgi:hypothetical protein
MESGFEPIWLYSDIHRLEKNYKGKIAAQDRSEVNSEAEPGKKTATGRFPPLIFPPPCYT